MRSYITTEVEIDFKDFADDELIEELQDRGFDILDKDELHKLLISFDEDCPTIFRATFANFLKKYGYYPK